MKMTIDKSAYGDENEYRKAMATVFSREFMEREGLTEEQIQERLACYARLEIVFAP